MFIIRFDYSINWPDFNIYTHTYSHMLDKIPNLYIFRTSICNMVYNFINGGFDKFAFLFIDIYVQWYTTRLYT